MTSKRPDLTRRLEATAARGGLKRVMAYAGRPGAMADARARAAVPRQGFTDRVDDGPTWPNDEPEVLGPRAR
jgi:hypothetical protein